MSIHRQRRRPLDEAADGFYHGDALCSHCRAPLDGERWGTVLPLYERGWTHVECIKAIVADNERTRLEAREAA